MGYQLTQVEFEQLFESAASIGNRELRDAVFAIWRDLAAEMSWDRLDAIPMNARTKVARSLVAHINGVTSNALALAESAQRTQGRSYDRDLLIAACLLHDASKLVEYEPPRDPSGLSAQKSELGKLLQHGAYAMHKVLQYKLPLELSHIVLTHTHASNVRGRTWETVILFYADFFDTDTTLLGDGEQLFMQRFHL